MTLACFTKIPGSFQTICFQLFCVLNGHYYCGSLFHFVKTGCLYLVTEPHKKKVTSSLKPVRVYT